MWSSAEKPIRQRDMFDLVVLYIVGILKSCVSGYIADYFLLSSIIEHLELSPRSISRQTEAPYSESSASRYCSITLSSGAYRRCRIAANSDSTIFSSIS